MTISNNVTTQNYNGSLLATNLLSGNSTTLVLSDLGPQSTTTVTENNNSLQVGETVHLGDGRTATVLGSGTIQPALLIGLGSSVPVVILQSGSQIIFLYPAGPPNLLAALSLQITATATDYTFPGGIICFAAGTLILTPDDEVPVESLIRG
ncbi:MAG: hypothetical protein IIX61_03210, partial [Loktanella sp.]|nr:hypothetical protein [Loktanella sp.]